MTQDSAPDAGPTTADPVADAVLATQLFLMAPLTLGGVVLRGYGPAREAVLDALQTRCTHRRLPSHIDDERLLGGVDIAASLAAGRSVSQTGLLAEIEGGVLIVPMAERLSPSVSGRLVQALDQDQAFGLVMLDDSNSSEDAPPESLLERVTFLCDLSAAEYVPDIDWQPGKTIAFEDVEPLDEEALRALAGTAVALGVHSLRPLLFAAQTARAHAAFKRNLKVTQSDLAMAVRLVLAPRATQIPPMEEPPEQPPEPPEQSPENAPDNSNTPDDGQLEDKLVEAAQASIPADLLEQLISGQSKRSASGSGSGQRRKSALRGKPLGARPGTPRGGARLALIDSLRAAVPWQPLRRREANTDDTGSILMRKDDLRIRRFEEKAARVTIFAVDASGSAAASRLAEAKGAVELMLAQAYVTRSEVALIAFRGESAEMLLPPTRSLTRARRALAELPGGGGTPLASGIHAARELAEMVASRGKTPSLVILTDGRGNIAADGTPGRKQASEDAEAAAKAVAARAIDALVVDISNRPGPDAPALAQSMHARFLALPRADAKTLHAAITAESKAQAAAA